MKLILFVLGLVAIASRIANVSATANPLPDTDIESTATTNMNASSEAIIVTNRRLQANLTSKSDDLPCSQDLNAVIGCTLSNCPETMCTEPSESTFFVRAFFVQTLVFSSLLFFCHICFSSSSSLLSFSRSMHSNGMAFSFCLALS